MQQKTTLPAFKFRDFKLLTAFLTLCVSLVLVESYLPNSPAQTRPELTGCMMLATLPHRRSPGERPPEGAAVTEVVCPNTVSIPTAGFTLIELSIVLVIIGLVVGGVVVGKDLITAAAVRAQISQIEKFNSATNTFYGKFGYLPGDIPAAPAAQFGFAARGTTRGEGDGNGLIEGKQDITGTGGYGLSMGGENGLFWVDLSTALLIDGGFSTATANQNITATATTTPPLGAYFPAGRIGQGSYIYVWSGGYAEGIGAGDGINYFALSNIFKGNTCYGTALTVQQAYNIDKKIDDGSPMSGAVTAQSPSSGGQKWAGGNTSYVSGSCNEGLAGASDSTTNGPIVSTDGVQAPLYNYSCYDNGNVAGATPNYSISQNLTYMNCVLSFKFQ